MTRNIIIGIVVFLMIAQFFGINKINPSTPSNETFYSVHNTPQDVQSIMDAACMDCHSHQTKYPWYTSIAPLSWWINHHIVEGREHLNFSTWTSYDKGKQDHKIEECIEVLEEGEMPLTSYTLIHGNAKLSSAQKERLISYLNTIQ